MLNLNQKNPKLTGVITDGYVVPAGSGLRRVYADIY
jgi:hypothetical protein